MPWKITIEGDGSHHNDAWPKDADRMMAQLVRDMKAAGHTVSVASFEAGEIKLDLVNPDVHILKREAVEAEFLRLQELEKQRQEEEQAKRSGAPQLALAPIQG